MSWLLSLFIRDSITLGRLGPFNLLPYIVPMSARHQHCYCIGTTGQGKSKFMESLVVQDILAGRGCGLIDPHTDLARDVLTNLWSKGYFQSPSALEKVIYFDPTRSDYVIPFNILKSKQHPYVLAQQVIEAFRRTWPRTLEEAPRFTNLALAVLLVLIETGQTLVDMPLVLTNRTYREHLLTQVHDPQVLDFFRNRFNQWGREAAIMMESVLNKAAAFTFNPYLRNCLGASDNRLDFQAIMDEGKVLIVDLGNCDGETRHLLGSLIMTGLEMAALARKDITGSRRPFYLFLDEFQDFSANAGSAKTLAQILAECRKFGLYLHLAHQTLGQIEHQVSSALGNVGLKVVFSTDREDAEILAPKLFRVNTEAVKHDAQTTVQHPLFSPLPEQWEEAVAAIQSQKPRQALVKQRGQDVVQITTQAMPSNTTGLEVIRHLQTSLAQSHGVPASSITRNKFTSSQHPSPVRIIDWDVTQTISHTLYDAGGQK
jgi:hypothetical protein